MKRAALRVLTLAGGVLLGALGCFQSACSSSLQGAEATARPMLGISEGEAPPGFIRMEVMGVLPTSEGNAVFLVDDEQERVLPIWIGKSEALAIQLRTERRRFERPLTHDLLENVLKELGGEVIRVHVDDLKSSTFVATVFVRTGDRVLSMDARPSDAIALAVGGRAPIFVAIEVVERAALEHDGIQDERFEPTPYDEPPPEADIPSERAPGIIGPPPTHSL